MKVIARGGFQEISEALANEIIRAFEGKYFRSKGVMEDSFKKREKGFLVDSHEKAQYALLKIDKMLECTTYVARGDRGKVAFGEKLNDISSRTRCTLNPNPKITLLAGVKCLSSGSP